MTDLFAVIVSGGFVALVLAGTFAYGIKEAAKHPASGDSVPLSVLACIAIPVAVVLLAFVSIYMKDGKKKADPCPPEVRKLWQYMKPEERALFVCE